MNKISILLAVSLMTASCNRDKPAEAGTQGMNATAAAADDAKANPTIDNPNVASDTEAPNPDAPVLTFTENQFDFGDIKPGSKVQHTFSFTNTGKTPLLIADATASCGCTTPSWTKEPVAPGAKGTLEVQFDSRGKQGLISKQVSVRANTQPGTTVINIKGNILTK
ncbi:MAG: DUF1573 domain-containing protein [Cytophagaceae bacterium]|nr:MAG: DUF1573 domain-containing protein [Cytophagaceae bacterium]